jgi:single stranded DNA-binding protein
MRVVVHDSRQNDRDPIMWQPGQDYRAADAIRAARTQPTRTRHGPERLGPERYQHQQGEERAWQRTTTPPSSAPGRRPRVPLHPKRHRRGQPARRRHPTHPAGGQWRDGDTSFFKVNVWRGQAEHLADSLTKGDRVMITGRLRQRSWETPEGEKRSVAEIEADEVGASLKWATAKVERTSQRGNGDRTQARERAAERGGDFNDPAPF